MGHAEFIDGGRYLVRISGRGAADVVDAETGEGVRVLSALSETDMSDVRDRACVEGGDVVIASSRGDVFRGSLDAGVWSRVFDAPVLGRVRRSRVAAKGQVVAVSHERNFDYKADDAILLVRHASGQSLVNLGEWVEVLAIQVSTEPSGRIECLVASHRWEHVRFLSIDIEGVVREEADIPVCGDSPLLARFIGACEFVFLAGDKTRSRVSLHSLSNPPGVRLLDVPESVERFARTFAVRRTFDGRLQLTTFANGRLHLLTLHGECVVARESMPADGVFRATLATESDHLYLDAIVKSDSDIRALGERSGICVLARAANGEGGEREEQMSPSSYFPPRILP